MGVWLLNFTPVPTRQNQVFVFVLNTQSGLKTVEYFHCTCMIIGQFISMRNNTMAHMKKTHLAKRPHLNYVYCITNILILFDMALFPMSCYLFTFRHRGFKV